MSESVFKPWLRWTLLVIAFVAAMVVAWRHVDAKARRELAAAKAAFAIHGFPTRVDEIVPAPVPEEDNADGLLHEAWRIVSGSPKWDGAGPKGIFREIHDLDLHIAPTPGGTPTLDAEALATLVSLVRAPEAAAFVEQIRRATRCPAWRLDLDYAQGAMLLLDHLSPARTMVQLLAKYATALAQDPATADQAWEVIGMIVVLSDWLDDEPTLISYLTGVAGHGIMRETVREILQTESTLSNLSPLIAQLLTSLETAPKAFENALHAERIIYLGWIERHLEGQRNWLAGVIDHATGPRWLRWSHPWLTPILSPIARPRLAAELRECHELHLEAAQALRDGGIAMLARLRAVEVRASTSEWVLPQIAFPSVEKFARTHLVQLTQRRAFIAVLAAFHHRQQSGAWPGSLRELGLPADTLVDACSSESLVLRIEDENVAVYGFGLDGDDDDGRAAERPHDAGSDGDIVVRVRVQLRP